MTSRPALRFRGAVESLSPDDRTALFDRAEAGSEEIRETVRRIVTDVRRNGDATLRRLARELDGAELHGLEVPRAAWERALDRTTPGLRRVLERAGANLATGHAAWSPREMEIETEPGITLRRRPDPIDRVGIYAPGGRAAYPSSVLMAAVPARVAGVGEITVCSPPGPDGAPPALVLAACAIAKVDRVFALGGAGAVAAMAYGTASVPRVDRIVGPGNAFVREAKLQVASQVAIDGPAGPSEVLVIADATTPDGVIVREMVAQAEHDPQACAVAVVVGDGDRADRLAVALAGAARTAERGEIVRAALAAAGGVFTARTLEAALEFAARYAPEHLHLAFRGADRACDRVRNAGAVFLGPETSVTFGDYMTGGNHVLPTGGLARAYSGLVPEDFIRWTIVQRVTSEAAAGLAADVADLARAEGLPGHAAAAYAWRASDA